MLCGYQAFIRVSTDIKTLFFIIFSSALAFLIFDELNSNRIFKTGQRITQHALHKTAFRE